MSALTFVFPIAVILTIGFMLLHLELPKKKQPTLRTGRFGPIGAAIITLVYGVTAFIGLGDTSAPQSFYIPEADQHATVTLSDSGAYKLGRVMVYAGIGTGSWTVVNDATGNVLFTIPQEYKDVLKWYEITPDVYESVESVTIYGTGTGAQLGEIAFYTAEGSRIDPVSATDAALIDEQALVPAEPTFRNSTYFDEIYHVRTAQEHLTDIKPYEISHPPLGKLILSLGILLFGLTPFGWRFMGTLFGVLMVPVMWRLVKEFFEDDRVALCATAVFAFDFMHFTQTRIATIDTYAVLFIMLMYLFMWRWLRDGKLRDLGLSGLFFAIGAASKWTCLYAGAGLGVLWLWHWIAEGIRANTAPKINRKKQPEALAAQRSSYWSALAKNILFCLGAFVALPLVIYYLSYTPYGTAKGLHGVGMYFSKEYASTVLENQKFMFTYHAGLESTHPYSAPWWKWLLDIRPILYYLRYGDGTVTSIAAFVNPVLCWGGLAAIVVCLVYALMSGENHDRRASFIVIGYLAQLLPWVFISRITFEYHYFACTVFLVLALALLFDKLRERGQMHLVYLTTGLSVALFALFYPALAGTEVSRKFSTYFLKWLPDWPL